MSTFSNIVGLAPDGKVEAGFSFLAAALATAIIATAAGRGRTRTEERVWARGSSTWDRIATRRV